ncbi:MAG: squalene synthase [Chitinophagales bacterium]
MVKDLIRSAHRPREVMAMMRLKFGGFDIKTYREPLEDLALTLNDREFCYAALNKVSRSFAIVINQLPLVLKDPVCVFYLVLRGLDSIEDDMTYPKEERLPLLRNFWKKNYISGWNIKGVGDSDDYRTLLANYHKVIAVFQSLHPQYQQVIADICEKMGNGMADYAERKVVTLLDYDHYCHYVAGLVGIGLSGLFSASGLEDEALKDHIRISNSMGLLLQKTNITRDYYEDLNLGRSFWPKEVWGKYADRLDELMKAPDSPESLACLNDLVTDALQYVGDCIEYLSLIRNPQVFRFCAIPQVMAMATLAKIYNNPNVYTEVVKIRKGIAAVLMLHTTDMESVHKVIEGFANDILKKLDKSDPNFDLTTERCHTIIANLHKNRYKAKRQLLPVVEVEKAVLF